LLPLLGVALLVAVASEVYLKYQEAKLHYNKAKDEQKKQDEFLSDPMHANPDPAGPNHWKTCAKFGAAAAELGSKIPGTTTSPMKPNLPKVPPKIGEAAETAEKLSDAAVQIGNAIDEHFRDK